MVEPYAVKVQQQIDQYKNVEKMHASVGAADYYNAKYERDIFRSVFAPAKDHLDFYALEFVEAVKATGNRNIVSIGSGDGLIEIGVARRMLKAGAQGFQIELTDLSPFQLKRAERNVKEAGLAQHFAFSEADLNNWSPSREYGGVMAHHSLHHIENLEGLFDAIRSCLRGSFCTMDMIGRNGHMRWPEVLELVQALWALLPPEKRRHPTLPGYEDGFYNHDCSTEGFEGIRAQDILPCLVERFGVKKFYAKGGLIDPFISRGFGPNFNPEDPWDRAFLDMVALLNARLIRVGHIKPTHMFAVMTTDMAATPTVHEGLTPEFCIRKP